MRRAITAVLLASLMAAPTMAMPRSLGVFRITYYCPCKRCSGRWGKQTASGATCTEGRTVAVDKRVIPLGTHLIIDGADYIAEDTGVYGRAVDIYLESHEECLMRGVDYMEVFEDDLE